MSAIPTAALDRGEQAVLAVLRRKHPDCVFVLRDGAVGPDDGNVAGKVAARATADDHTVEESG